MVKKYGIALMAFVIGTQLSAETVIDVLGQFESSSEFLTIVTNAQVPEFQARSRAQLNRLLSQDIDTVTPDQMEAIKRTIDSVVNAMSSSIQDLSKEEFTNLADEVKAELQEVIQQAETKRLADEAAKLQRLADQTAALQKLEEETRLAESALIETIILQAAPVLSVDMMGAEEPLPDTIAPLALDVNAQIDNLAQLAEELKSLDETTSSDPVDLAFLNHGDTLEDFMADRMSDLKTPTEQEYQNALGLFFKNKGLEIDEKTLLALANRLRDMQTIYYEQAEEDEEEDIEALLAQLTKEEQENLLKELENAEWDRLLKVASDNISRLDLLTERIDAFLAESQAEKLDSSTQGFGELPALTTKAENKRLKKARKNKRGQENKKRRAQEIKTAEANEHSFSNDSSSYYLYTMLPSDSDELLQSVVEQEPVAIEAIEYVSPDDSLTVYSQDVRMPTPSASGISQGDLDQLARKVQQTPIKINGTAVPKKTTGQVGYSPTRGWSLSHPGMMSQEDMAHMALGVKLPTTQSATPTSENMEDVD